jgi:hypothetical protein
LSNRTFLAVLYNNRRQLRQLLQNETGQYRLSKTTENKTHFQLRLLEMECGRL